MDINQFKTNCKKSHKSVEDKFKTVIDIQKRKVQKFNKMLVIQEQYGKDYMPTIYGKDNLCPNCDTALDFEFIGNTYNDSIQKFYCSYILKCPKCGYEYAQKVPDEPLQ